MKWKVLIPLLIICIFAISASAQSKDEKFADYKLHYSKDLGQLGKTLQDRFNHFLPKTFSDRAKVYDMFEGCLQKMQLNNELKDEDLQIYITVLGDKKERDIKRFGIYHKIITRSDKEVLGISVRSIISSYNLHNINDLKSYFSEPILVLDTLFIDLSKIAQSNDKIYMEVNGQRIKLPASGSHNNIYYLTSGTFFDLPLTADSTVQFTLINEDYKSMQAKGALYFMTVETNNMLRKIMEDFKELSPSEKLSLFSDYAQTMKGCNLDRDNLNAWLLKQGKH